MVSDEYLFVISSMGFTGFALSFVYTHRKLPSAKITQLLRGRCFDLRLFAFRY